jgi:hypothetical protein
MEKMAIKKEVVFFSIINDVFVVFTVETRFLENWRTTI